MHLKRSGLKEGRDLRLPVSMWPWRWQDRQVRQQRVKGLKAERNAKSQKTELYAQLCCYALSASDSQSIKWAQHDFIYPFHVIGNFISPQFSPDISVVIGQSMQTLLQPLCRKHEIVLLFSLFIKDCMLSLDSILVGLTFQLLFPEN